MPNPEHLAALKQGVEQWNHWREEHSGIKPDLSGADLSGMNLNRADLSGAKLSKANLSWANFSKANLSWADLGEPGPIGANLSLINLSGADLSKADLSRADLSGADLNGAILNGADLREANFSEAKLSGAVINEDTQYRQARGCTKGVNGFYSEKTDSAALMTLTPPGDSMKGANASAVVESLKQARSLHVFSMTLAALVFYIAVLKPEKIKLPLIDEKIPIGQFGLFAMSFSVGFLTLAASFMSDARRGARWLHSRDDAMRVGQFPWALSRFSDPDWRSKLLSCLIRFVMAFHPLVYLYFLFGKQWPYPRWVFIVFGVPLLFLSWRVFSISQRFQRPILFDRRTEEERQSDLAKLAKSVEEQTKAMTKLITLLEPKQSIGSGANDTEIGLKE
jgi:Pentapeptide repeats (8 copies)